VAAEDLEASRKKLDVCLAGFQGFRVSEFEIWRGVASILFLTVKLPIVDNTMSSEDLPVTWTQRIRNDETLEKFEALQEELEDRTRKYSRQAVGLFIIDLAFQRLERLREEEEKFEDAVP